jgi:hypothetical protein
MFRQISYLPAESQRIVEDIVTIQLNTAGTWLQKANQHPKGCGFTCSIRPQKTNNLFIVNAEAYLIHSLQIAEAAA